MVQNEKRPCTYKNKLIHFIQSPVLSKTSKKSDLTNSALKQSFTPLSESQIFIYNKIRGKTVLTKPYLFWQLILNPICICSFT